MIKSTIFALASFAFLSPIQGSILPPLDASISETIEFCENRIQSDLFCEVMEGHSLELSEIELIQHCNGREKTDLLCRARAMSDSTFADHEQDCRNRYCNPYKLMGHVTCVSAKCNYCDVGGWNCSM